MSSQQQAIKQNPNPPKPKFSKTEFIFKVGFFIVLFLTAWLAKKLHEFRNDPLNQKILYGKFQKLLWCFPGAAIIHILKSIVVKIYKPRILPITHVSDPSKKDERATRLSRWIFDIFFMLAVSVIAVVILKDHQSFPRLVNGWPTALNVTTRQVPKQFLFNFELLYLLELSSYIQATCLGLYELFFTKHKSFEFLLHDGITVFLIVYSYLFSMWVIGIITMFLHDYSDFVIVIGRFYNGITQKSQLFFNCLIVVTFLTWIGCRIILFPLLCIQPLYAVPNRPIEMTMFLWMFIALFCMHVYWTYMMYASVTNSKRKRHSSEY